MKKNSKDQYKDIDDFFAADFTSNQKAWSMIHNYYNLILSEMKKKEIKRTDIAAKLKVTPAAVSKLLNKTPNISLRKMVELADSVGLDFELRPVIVQNEIENPTVIYLNWNIKSETSCKIEASSSSATWFPGKHYYEPVKPSRSTVNEELTCYGG
mgnify:CR=1 FL=1